MSLRLAPLLALLVAAAACVDEAAPAKCRGFRDAYCAAQENHCEGVTWDACRDLFDELLVCDDAVGVEQEYADCMADIAALEECPNDLPDNCRGVVLFEDDYFEEDEDDEEVGGDGGAPGGGFDAGVPLGEGGPP